MKKKQFYKQIKVFFSQFAAQKKEVTVRKFASGHLGRKTRQRMSKKKHLGKMKFTITDSEYLK